MGEIVTFLLFLGGIAAAAMLWALVSEIVAAVEDFRCGDCGKLVAWTNPDNDLCLECERVIATQSDKRGDGR